MRAHVSDGEEFFFFLPWEAGHVPPPSHPLSPVPFPFLSSCQSGLMRLGGASVLGRAVGMRDAAPQQLSVCLDWCAATEDTEHET